MQGLEYCFKIKPGEIQTTLAGLNIQRGKYTVQNYLVTHMYWNIPNSQKNAMILKYYLLKREKNNINLWIPFWH